MEKIETLIENVAIAGFSEQTSNRINQPYELKIKKKKLKKNLKLFTYK
jgi:hypothetical protein